MTRRATVVTTLLLFSLTGCAHIASLFKNNAEEILRHLLTEDTEGLKHVLTSAAACEALKELQEEKMLHTPIFIKDGHGACLVADVNADDRGAYFSDEACAHPVSFEPTAYQPFCKEIIVLEKPNTVLGNAATWEANDSAIGNTPSRKWTVAYGTRMKLTMESLEGNAVPYMKQVNYKTIRDTRNPDGSTRGDGTCRLEMRVYKRDITARNLKPLLNIHGGSWKLRGAGFPGLEAAISHFTDQGFIVFSPFYRLAGDSDGNAECNNASWQDLVSDVEDALTWVWRNGEAVGAAGGRPVALTGQSAGAHLATWLLAHPERHGVPVSRALLLYPPTDFQDFVAHAVTGGRYEGYTRGIETFENFFGVDDIGEVSTEVLAAHSFPALVRRNPETPPVFIIHGNADKTVPSMQSVRLCNAYERSLGPAEFDSGPAANNGGDPADGVYTRQYHCGSVASQLHLFAQADHALDLKCIPGLLCQAGSQKTIPALEESLKAGRRWLTQGP